ncbi:translational activator of cytochrome c oxidase 1 [Zootoca vivipara]|uniref:translational activator of cytochrome c oxidase 1 n=1 Tax=Zootoca vivipara TaxID=8524 RepID=UPI00159021E5|nr:translational activator of cytochrome c oxidase 1 [Zootoca vivipara]XP_034992982.1 translational activator of cytochrome c oxidase 1 [Zootoca vivipara]
MSVGSSLLRMRVLFRPHLLMLLDHPHRAVHTSCAAFAGHNKWSKVKNIKGPKDEARARLFQKLSMLIRLAVRDGGPNPELNTNLANIIEQCRSKSMPKASIEAALTCAEKIKSSYLLYGVRGPGGCTLLIEILTDSAKRSSNDIRHLLNKHGGQLVDGAQHSFVKKGVVAVSSENRSGSTVTLDQALELAIEAGAEDVQEEEDENEKMLLKFVCAVPTLHQVREKLNSLGLCTVSAGFEFIPTFSAQLSDEQMGQALQLLEALRNNLDVVRVYDNIA